MEIKELNVHTRKVITKSFNREVFGETVTIYCQKLTEKSKTIWFKPKGLLLNMHYLYPIYLYAVTLYNETNLSQRDVCKCVQEKFNLKSFNASTLCRYLKMLHCEIKVKVENNTKEEVLEDIKQHKNNLKNKSNDVKKLITKERYFQTLKKKFLNLKKNFCNKIEDIYPYFLQYVKKEIYGNKYFMTLGIFKHYPFKSERENFGN
jgi:hypothetical protein